MPLSSSIVGMSSDAHATDIDARWTMAYAAGLGDTLERYFDTRRAGEVIAHPLFAVCYEWPVLVAAGQMIRAAGLTAQESARGVHVTHDLILHGPLRPPARLRTRLTIEGVERRKPGAYQLTRLDTIDASGAPVNTTYYGTIYRGVEVDGPDRPASGLPESAPTAKAADRARAEIPVAVPAGAAHVYTECARIWNPIHTDPAVAQAAGLPAIILHGTATLALAISRVIGAEASDEPSRVTGVAARFGAMVFMPSEIVVRILARARVGAGIDGVHFEVLNHEGKHAVRDGYITVRV
jgi:acyl dehydratase